MLVVDVSQESDVGDVSVVDVLVVQVWLCCFLLFILLYYVECFGIWLKLENLQCIGFYKVCGVLNVLLVGCECGDIWLVICVLVGNYVQGVVWVVYCLDVLVIIVMLYGVLVIKIVGVVYWGVIVCQYGISYDEVYVFVVELVQCYGYCFLFVFDDVDVIVGQGIVGIELVVYVLDVVIVLIGGGGLVFGVVLVLKLQGVCVIGVQVEGVDLMVCVICCDVCEIVFVVLLVDGVWVKIFGFLI